MKKFAGFIISGAKSFYGYNCSVEGFCGRVDIVSSVNGKNPKVFITACGSMAFPTCDIKLQAEEFEKARDFLLEGFLPMGKKYLPAIYEALALLRELPEPSLENCNPQF